MAHEIESIMWYGDRPWHGLGVEVLQAQTSEEAIVKAGLDWEVKKREIFLADGTKVPGYFAVVRTTDNKPLGVVGGRYVPLQNKSAFTFFDGLIGSKEAIYETAGSLRGGKIIWIMSRLPGHIGWADDPIEQWFVLSNAHDGSRQVSLMATPVRVVCLNTLNAALRGVKVKFEMRHTSGIMDRVIDAREALGVVTDYFTEMEGVLKLLRNYSMSDQETKSYIHSLFPLKVETNETLAGFGDTLNVEFGPRIKKYIEKVMDLHECGKGSDIPGVKGTAYGAFNAACEFADHWQPVRGKPKGEVGSTGQLFKKLDSIWFGSAQRFKQRAFDQAVGLVC